MSNIFSHLGSTFGKSANDETVSAPSGGVPDSPDISPDLVDAAANTLRENGVPEAIVNLGRGDPSAMTQWAESVLERQEQEHGGIEQAISRLEQQVSANSPAPPQAKVTPPSPQTDPGVQVSGTKPPVDPHIAELQGQLQAMVNLMNKEFVSQNVDTLRGQYPDFDARLPEVQARAQRQMLAGSGISEAWREAALLTFGPPAAKPEGEVQGAPAASEADGLARLRALQSNSQPTPPSARQDSVAEAPAFKNLDEARAAIENALESGNVEEAATIKAALDKQMDQNLERLGY